MKLNLISAFVHEQVVNATTQMMMFQRAQYCPAPPGDSITRKSLFDSLVSGCVPVLFAKASLRQYLWFFNESEVKSCDTYFSLVNFCSLVRWNECAIVVRIRNTYLLYLPDGPVSLSMPLLPSSFLRFYSYFYLFPPLRLTQISEVSVFIPKQQIQESGVNFLEVLRSIPPAELLRKQRAIARIAPRLQYSVVSECEV